MQSRCDPGVRSQYNRCDWCDRCDLGAILGCDLSVNLVGAWLGWATGAWRQTVCGVEVGAWAGAEMRLVRV